MDQRTYSVLTEFSVYASMGNGLRELWCNGCGRKVPLLGDDTDLAEYAKAALKHRCLTGVL